MVFVNSITDLFHREVPAAYIQRVFDTMRGEEYPPPASWHTFRAF